MNSEVTNNARLLSKAVCTTLSDTASQQDRAEAYQFLENFKEKSSHACVDCGFMMAKKENLDIERHFGLQLLEHAVKFKWQELDIDRKLFVMENTMGLIANGTNDILNEKMFIKDALTRILVEMIKKEWPQQWPDLLQKLEMLSALGTTQTELVLFVFLRLAEDIVKFQILPGQRRREIHQTLNTQMQSIFNFFINVLDNKVKSYLQYQNAEHEKEKIMARSNCRVARTVLLTLTGYVDWVNHNILFETNATLLSMLCLLLSDEHLQLHAADVLLLIVSRKGKAEERKPLLSLFKDDPMSMILNAAVQASAKDLEEIHYLFLKTLCQVLVGIGMQLCALWGTEAGVGKPDNFHKYLHAIMAITGHASQTLGSFTHPLWVQFIKHSEISKDSDFQSVLPELMLKASVSLQKVGYPSQSNSPCCLFSRLDFDSDEDFNAFFSKFRADVSETIRTTTVILPMMTAKMAGEWLFTMLNKPLELGPGAEHGHCNLKSPAFIEWDAMTCFLENVQSRLAQSEKPVPDVQDGLKLLKAVVEYKTEDPLILSCVLSCISATFQYIVHAPEMLPTILNKIFATVVFNLEGQTKSTRIKSVQNVRRHACSIMVKICKNYAPLLVPGFDELCRHVESISQDSENVSQMERVTLMEALILISNQFMNYEKQSQFLANVLQPISEFWLSAEVNQALESPANFMRFIGLDKRPVEPGLDDECGIHRATIGNALNTILAVIKRSTWPEDAAKAREGGFIAHQVGGKEILKNPAIDHVMVLIGNVFRLIYVSNQLWIPENQALCHPEFAGAFDLPEVEKQVLLGNHPKCVDNTDVTPCKQPVERMLNFLQLSNDNVYHILGNAGKSLRQGFFSAPELVSAVLEKIFSYLGPVPDYRVRPLVRSFMKPLVQQCPEEMYSTICLPILTVLGQFMLERLTAKWQTLHLRNTVKDEDGEENPESKEILEDLLIRQLTREYMELLTDIFIVKKNATSNGDVADDVTMEEEAPTTDKNDVTISELGKLALRLEQCCQPLVLSMFGSLSWNDTTTCHKAIPLCGLVLKQLLSDKILSADAAVHLYTAILAGLQLHGQHEATQPLLINLALTAYQTLRPTYPDIVTVMHQIKSCSPTDLKNFDDKFSQPNNQHQKSSEKKRKEAFRKLVCDVIAKSLAQQFRKEVPIQELPRLFIEKKVKPKPTVEIKSEDAGLTELFKDDVE